MNTRPPGFSARQGERASCRYAAGLVLTLLIGLWLSSGAVAGEPPGPPAATFVGGARCAVCHASEYAAWQGSHHARAMQEASDQTVLGDFNEATFTHFGLTSRFFRRDQRFLVTTDGPDGAPRDYEIKYTFGVTPLQQYLIEFPGGRLQALTIAWDSRPKEQGGGRWFHLYPHDRIAHQDELHWTRRAQNWNWMCADCHSTHLRRHYDASSATYRTTWSEINVSCEACHGPGSNHVAWAEQAPAARTADATKGLLVALDERRGARWSLDAAWKVARDPPLTTRREVEVCAQCHARRAPLADGLRHGGSLLETHDPALLTEGLYFADGQQQDEVYNYGSFLQSKMFARGVVCSDCHEPHSGKPRASGNALCTQCHLPARYDQSAHTLHPVGSDGARCVACHLPTRTYMAIDPRHDHSLRIPRPDLAQRLGTPDACTGCHPDQGAEWAAGVIERAFGPERKGYQTFASALQAGRGGEPGAAAKLVALIQDAAAPAIARASAVALLSNSVNSQTTGVIAAALADADPLVRGAALSTLLAWPAGQRVRLAFPLLDDPQRMVRIKAARALAVIPSSVVPAAQQARFEHAFAEYLASQQANAERPESHLNLGLFHTDRQQFAEAESAYREALRLDAGFAPAAVNLADLYRASGREVEAETLLLECLTHRPEDGDLAHALGLLRVRQGRPAEALALFTQALERRPDNPRYAYVQAVTLHETGTPKEARAALERALQRFPNDPELLTAALSYARKAGDSEAAQRLAQRLSAVMPEANPDR